MSQPALKVINVLLVATVVGLAGEAQENINSDEPLRRGAEASATDHKRAPERRRVLAEGLKQIPDCQVFNRRSQ